ncbi:MAG: trigger factor [bacterium]|nr:trigger factor [bacterium]
MKIDVTDLEDSKKEVTVEIPEDVVTRKINTAYRLVGSVAKLKGFRPGKVPRDLLKTYFWNKIESEVIKDLVPEYFEKAVAEKKLQLIGQPEFAGEFHVQEHAPLSFKVIVTTWPRVELPPYRGIEIEREKVEVTEEDIQAALKDLQEQHARYQAITDRPIREGDLVIIDYEILDQEGQTLIYKKKDALIIPGAQPFLPEFSQKLIGLTKGEEREYEVDFPPDYPNNRWAGKKFSFKLVVKEIKEKVLPEIDDDFAKDWEFDSLTSLKEQVAEKIKKMREGEAKTKMADSLLHKLLAQTSITPPQALIEEETDELVYDLELQLLAQGQVLDQAKENLAKVREHLRETAVRNVKVAIILQEIALREGIEVTPAEIDHQIQLLARQYNKSPEEMSKKLSKAKIERNIQERKTIDFLLEQAQLR